MLAPAVLGRYLGLGALGRWRSPKKVLDVWTRGSLNQAPSQLFHTIPISPHYLSPLWPEGPNVAGSNADDEPRSVSTVDTPQPEHLTPSLWPSARRCWNSQEALDVVGDGLVMWRQLTRQGSLDLSLDPGGPQLIPPSSPAFCRFPTACFEQGNPPLPVAHPSPSLSPLPNSAKGPQQ